MAIREIRRLGGNVLVVMNAPVWLRERTPAGVEELFGAVWEVDFDNRNVTDSDLLILQSLKNPRHVFLSDTRVSDEGLASIGKIASLRELDLSRTQITDVGLRHVSELKQLRHLYIHETLVRKASLIELAENRPGLTVYANGVIYR